MEEGKKSSKHDKAYILKQFPNEKFVPDTWIDILTTVDVYANVMTPIVFCDKEGYNIFPIHMVRAIQEGYKDKEDSQEEDRMESSTMTIAYSR